VVLLSRVSFDIKGAARSKIGSMLSHRESACPWRFNLTLTVCAKIDSSQSYSMAELFTTRRGAVCGTSLRPLLPTQTYILYLYFLLFYLILLMILSFLESKL